MKNWYWWVGRKCCGVVLNGWVVSIYKGLNTKKWHFKVYPNIWRKTRV